LVTNCRSVIAAGIGYLPIAENLIAIVADDNTGFLPRRNPRR
jgi:hypothetical protein